MGYDISHAVAGGFSPAIATALFSGVGTYAVGLIYVVFGAVSLCGIYITFCCGGNQKEVDTGEPTTITYAPTLTNGSSDAVDSDDLEIKESHSSDNSSDNGENSDNFNNII
jgi:hypothetical protein